MNIKTYIALSVSLVGLLMQGCASDINDNETLLPSAGGEFLTLAGVSVSSDAVGSNTFITAKLTEDPSKTYIGETQINMPLLSGTPSMIIFPVSKPTYPLADKEINLYAYTGKTKGGKMTLKAGKGATFDAILSNNGQRGTQPVDPTNEGKGTLGSGSNPASILHFRHVMTQIVVDVKVDMTENPPVDPVPTSIQIKMDDLVAQGEYDITAKEPVAGDEANADKATATSGKYALQLGANYVIPNGVNLKGKNITSLVIDDYTATAEDLAKFVIAPLSGANDFYLLPGYSYKLTFTVSRLQVTGVTLTVIPWETKELTGGDITYDSQILQLDMGDYTNTGDDAITKVVLYTSDNKTYVGGTGTGKSGIQFVTLPATGKVNKTDFYTKKGLLLTSAITSEYENSAQNKKLTIPTSVGGMSLLDPSQSASAANPYLIRTALQFINIEKNLSASYQQSVDIDLNTLKLDKFSGFEEFKGIYDGDGYRISNLNLVGAGLTKVNSGTLKNIRIYTGTIDAKGIDFAGSMAGTNNGTIVACFNEALIANSTGTVGGIVGKNSATGTVVASHNTGVVSHGGTVGGIVGENLNTNASAIAACVNTGTLYYKATKLGGIAGISSPSTNSIFNTCYWLIGSAERYIGSKETAVDSDDVGRVNTSSRDVSELRNGISQGDTEADRIVNRLNAEISNFPAWSSLYHYILDPLVTGSAWPIPRKK